MYKRISTIGTGSVINGPYYTNDPLTYCLGNNVSQRFNHGSNADIYGQNSKPCQEYLSQRCASNWDEVCEYAFTNDEYLSRANPILNGNHQIQGLSSSDILLLNTAYKKYLHTMYNCEAVSEPFDPLVVSSPIITSWKGYNCVPTYAVDPRTIDSDPVMNRLLLRPWIAKDLFENIRTTMTRLGTFNQLKGTKLGALYTIRF